MKKTKIIAIVLICMLTITGCDVLKPKVYKYTSTTTTVVPSEEIVTYRFAEEYYNEYEINANPNVPSCNYQKAAFLLEEGRMSYGQTEYDYRAGIDVSYYQETIDWEKVKSDGIEFVYVRLGYRGYDDGALYLDEKFKENIQGAQAVDIDVGVYFFSQATDEKEAIEEAKYVIHQLEGYRLQLPIAYDMESITGGIGRMDRVTSQVLTQNAVAFCKTIEESGFDAMIYCNMYWEAHKLNLEQLIDYEIWYADYNRYPQTPYHFQIWQYTDQGNVEGINGKVDLNIQMIRKEKEE